MGFAIEEERQQRAGLFLRDVKYRIHADLVFDQAKDPEANYGKYVACLSAGPKGQCFNQPYLGCRNFPVLSAWWRKRKKPAPIQETRSLGWMLYDMDYQDPTNPMPLFLTQK